MAVPNVELAKALEKFVCVRLVQMWGVDLTRFQFDGELTWAVFFMNADGTIYGRYGTRSALGKGADRDVSLDGFQAAMAGALELHERYAGGDAALAAALAKKAPRGVEWKTPERVPGLATMPRARQRFTGERGKGKGCIHCHFVPTRRVASLRTAKREVANRDLYPYPVPAELGLHMDPCKKATVARVAKGTVAAAWGLGPGDEIVSLGGQPILSTADIQWVLHHAGDEDRVPARVASGGETRVVELVLPKGWRAGTGAWRYNNMLLMRSMFGVAVKELGPVQRRRRGIADDEIPLFVAHTWQKDPRMRGIDIRRGDVIVAVEGRRERITAGALARYCLDHKPSGSKLELTVRRGKREHTVELTAW